MVVALTVQSVVMWKVCCLQPNLSRRNVPLHGSKGHAEWIGMDWNAVHDGALAPGAVPPELTTLAVSVWFGLALSSLHDAWHEEPWVLANGRLVGHALTVKPAELAHALTGRAGWDPDLLPLASVMQDWSWGRATTRKPFQQAWEQLLDGAREASHVRAEECALQEVEL